MRKRLLIAVLFGLVLIPGLVFSSPEDTLKKATQYILSVQEENGAWSRAKGEFPPETEPTAWAVKALAMIGKAPEQAEKGIAFVLKDQKPDGSWNNNTAHTAFAIIALKQAGKGDEAVKRGFEYLRTVQDQEGGFRRIGKEGQPLTVYTAVVLCAAKDAGLAKNDPLVRMAMDWLMGCQNADGGYGMPKGTPSMALGTAWTVRALRAYGVAPASPFVQDAIEWILKVQKPTGGFSMVPPAPEDPEITAYVIMGLNGLTERREVLAKAADYLGKAQQADGAFISAAPIQFNKVAKKNTQTTAFVAWALAEMK
jgi:prenyltransferase beta subunit